MSTNALVEDAGQGYTLTISRLTIDKLGVKLYDKVSAVVAELIANCYDADAEVVTVELPLGTELASKDPSTKQPQDKGYEIVVRDDGHGMSPTEARAFYLKVGRDRRTHPEQGGTSRTKDRPVMGRKGIGKLAPFGICRQIEVLSAGGDEIAGKGYLTTHFFLDFDKIVTDDEKPVQLEVGEQDETYSAETGTTVRLTQFLSKRVPDSATFIVNSPLVLPLLRQTSPSASRISAPQSLLNSPWNSSRFQCGSRHGLMLLLGR